MNDNNETGGRDGFVRVVQAREMDGAWSLRPTFPARSPAVRADPFDNAGVHGATPIGTHPSGPLAS